MTANQTANQTWALPQLGARRFLTDGGLETTLIFHQGIDLPLFAAIVLLEREEGRAVLDRYFETYLAIAREAGTGFVLESATWRASRDWAAPLALGEQALADLNRQAIVQLQALRTAHATQDMPIVVSGCIGPRGDGYDPGLIMTVAEARAYHGWQVALFAEQGADMVTAMTMTNLPEATGVVLAAQDAGLPVAISFTLETDGRLPTGETLVDAIVAVDRATGDGPAYYMINCAHPSHFAGTLADGGDALQRIRGIRANASRRSHAELDEAADLDAGDPEELGEDYRRLLAALPGLTILGGCCGTDHRHVMAIAARCAGS
ncbi:homocysteine S-methyltransferase family protein [Novosphingobium sp. JCM 18896]|uniref:homocysteine S-methyltransferase family protein n=1 Tax=Novosphingobium sp. JCM 18896 TaxID=2989731 RepID=UPI0022232A00|nr:homocysteine S-methyltransferase family protein [Novosphingobium sp. JCM 18896]MCW1429130.1 homocysteine S-methyltransferase family protein [Novosphingobium sp. JCM 18896]